MPFVPDKKSSFVPDNLPAPPKKSAFSGSFGNVQMNAPRRDLSKDVGSYAYGLGTTLYGMLGDITDGAAGPTTEETQREISKQTGYKPASQGFVTAGEMTPLAVGVGRAIPSVAKGLAKAPGIIAGLGSDVFGTLSGSRVAKSAEELQAQAKALEAAGKTKISEAQVSGKKALEKSAVKSEQAKAAVERAEKEKGKALARTFGTRMMPEGGTYKPIPQTLTDVGNYARTQANNFLKAVKSQRNAAANLNFTNAKNAAKTGETLGINVDTKPVKDEIDSLLKKGGSSDYVRSLTQLRNDLENTKSFEGLEIIRRRLGDAAFGAPEEGYAAIDQQLAGRMYRSLEGQMRTYFDNFGTGEFGKYLDDYKRLSKNIEVYGTRLGKAITKTQDSAGRYVEKTSEQVAKDIFKSPESYEMFVDAVGRNKQIAESIARRYFSGQVETVKTAKEFEDFLRKNRTILNKVPGVRDELVNKFLPSFQKAERVERAAGDIATILKDEDREIASRLKNIPGAENVFSDSVNALASSEPGKSVDIFEKTVMPKIRQAESQAGVQLITPEQAQMLRQQVANIDRLQGYQTKARWVAGLLATYVLGKKTVSGIGDIYENVFATENR